MSILEEIKRMDKKSDRFYQVYLAVTQKYFDFDNPDVNQKAAQVLNAILNSGDLGKIGVVVKLYSQLIDVMEQDIKATHGSFFTKKGEYHFDIYTDKNALTHLEKMLRQTVTVQGSKQ